MEKIRERYNKLMCEVGWDHRCNDDCSVSEMVAECKYVLEVYEEDRECKSEIGKLKRFIARYDNHPE